MPSSRLDASIADRAAAKAKGAKSLVFCESRALTEIIAERLRDRGPHVFVHHSSVSLEERELAEEGFQRGGDASIVCTSTLAYPAMDVDVLLHLHERFTGEMLL